MIEIERGTASRERGWWLAPTVSMLWFAQVAVLLVAPILVMVAYSVSARDVGGGVTASWSLEAWQALSTASVAIVVAHSAGLALATTLAAASLGIPVALSLYFAPRRMRVTGRALLIAPLVLNPLLVAYGWFVLLGRDGVASTALAFLLSRSDSVSLLFNDWAVLVCMTGAFLPFFVAAFYSALEQLDPGMVVASEGMGASRLETVRSVLIPLSRHGIVAGCLLVGLPAFVEYLIPSVLSGNKTFLLGTQIQYEFYQGRNWPLGAALLVVAVLVLSVPTIAVIRQLRSALLGGAA